MTVATCPWEATCSPVPQDADKAEAMGLCPGLRLNRCKGTLANCVVDSLA